MLGQRLLWEYVQSLSIHAGHDGDLHVPACTVLQVSMLAERMISMFEFGYSSIRVPNGIPDDDDDDDDDDDGQAVTRASMPKPE